MVVTLVSSFLVYLTALVVAIDTQDPVKYTATLPDFVIRYAPLSYLHSSEQYWPSDVATHLLKVIPEVNFAAVGGPPTLQTLSALGNNVYLTAVDDPLTHSSAFFTSVVGRPVNGISAAPATIIVVQKPGGITDAFYFYFYSFNYGNAVLGLRWGNHVGDWEHTMVRFVNGVPDVVYYSEHNGGSAYKYSAVEKIGGRPVSYAAIGTHANYATPGDHNYEHIPFGLLKDETNQGPVWDITQNFRGFWYTPSDGTVSTASGAGTGGAAEVSEGASWLKFGGAYGDQQWPTSRFGQYCVGTECHMVSGPLGPLSKNLGRTAPCENEKVCNIQTSLWRVHVSTNMLLSLSLSPLLWLIYPLLLCTLSMCIVHS